MKKKQILCIMLSVFLLPMFGSGETQTLSTEELVFSEDDMFATESSVIPEADRTDDGILDAINRESVTFSGELSSLFGYHITQRCFDGDDDWGKNPYNTRIAGDFLVDVRLTKGIKAFADLWGEYSPQTSLSAPDADEAAAKSDVNFKSRVREFFVDANIKHKAYFRFGKQNLKWGQGYLWNPTDLLSQDRKNFSDLDARRNGVYGLKIHVPAGTTWNFYGFVNATDAARADEMSVAGKLETLLPQDIEISVSAWAKKDHVAVFGFDWRTYKFKTSWWGELSLSHGNNRPRMTVNDTPAMETGAYGKVLGETKRNNEWVPRVSLGLTKGFDFMNVKKRISVTTEVCYNHSGYEQEMLRDEETRMAFLAGNYFEPGNYGKYYAAIFTSVQKFLISDMTLNLNAIGNLSDWSGMVSAGLDYSLTHNAFLQCELTGYFGAKHREYTLGDTRLSSKVALEIQF